MKLSSAAITVAALSFLSTTHAIPLAFKNGEIVGRLHHRRGSDSSDISDYSASASTADQALDELDYSFEPSVNLILPRILNFFKRQVDTAAASASSSESDDNVSTGTPSATSGTTDTDAVTELMAPDSSLEDYGFASEDGPASALAEVKE